jgi:hypothetical protein
MDESPILVGFAATGNRDMPPIVLDGIGGRRAFPRASAREIALPGVLTARAMHIARSE